MVEIRTVSQPNLEEGTAMTKSKPNLRSAEEIVPIFANRFQVTVGPQITRIAFGEAVGEEVNYHSAMVTLTIDAEALADLIKEVIRRQHAFAEPASSVPS
jgi:hypothetical protein